MMVMQDNPGLEDEKELKIIGTEEGVRDAVIKVNLMIIELSLKKMRSALSNMNLGVL